MAESKKHPGGRPSKYDSIDLELVRRLVLAGLTDEKIAGIIGVAESTYHLWKKAHPEFSEAQKDWKDEADACVERSLYHRACGWEDPDGKVVPPDTKAAIFWLKNRKRQEWRDKIEHGVDANIKVNVVSYSDENCGKPQSGHDSPQAQDPDSGN